MYLPVEIRDIIATHVESCIIARYINCSDNTVEKLDLLRKTRFIHYVELLITKVNNEYVTLHIPERCKDEFFRQPQKGLLLFTKLDYTQWQNDWGYIEDYQGKSWEFEDECSRHVSKNLSRYNMRYQCVIKNSCTDFVKIYYSQRN